MNYEPLMREALRREQQMRLEHESLRDRYMRVLYELARLLGGGEEGARKAIAIAWEDNETEEVWDDDPI